MKKNIALAIALLSAMPCFFMLSAQEVEDVKQQFEYAEQLLATNQPCCAIKEYLKVIYLYPASELQETALFKVTECLVRVNNPWAAIEQCENFIKKYPNSKFIKDVEKRIATAKKISHTSLGYSEPPGLTLREKVASKYIDFGTDLLNSSESKGDTGEIIYNKERLAKAFYWFDKVIQEFPDTYIVAKAQYYRAMAFIKQERQADYNKAIEDLQKVVDNYPNTIWADEALKKIGDIYQNNLVDKSKAVATFQKLIDKKKDDSSDYYVIYAKAMIKYLQ